MVVISSETIPLGFSFIQSFLTTLQAFHISMHCFWIPILIASPAKSNHKPHLNYEVIMKLPLPKYSAIFKLGSS